MYKLLIDSKTSKGYLGGGIKRKIEHLYTLMAVHTRFDRKADAQEYSRTLVCMFTHSREEVL
jgi:hypothetical protein